MGQNGPIGKESTRSGSGFLAYGNERANRRRCRCRFASHRCFGLRSRDSTRSTTPRYHRRSLRLDFSTRLASSAFPRTNEKSIFSRALSSIVESSQRIKPIALFGHAEDYRVTNRHADKGNIDFIRSVLISKVLRVFSLRCSLLVPSPQLSRESTALSVFGEPSLTSIHSFVR